MNGISHRKLLQIGVIVVGLVGAVILGIAISKQNQDRACGNEGFVPSNHLVSPSQPKKVGAGSPMPPMPGFRRVNFYNSSA